MRRNGKSRRPNGASNDRFLAGRLMWWPKFLRRNADGRAETAALADELMKLLGTLAAEHRERDAREGVVLVANTLMERLEMFAPEYRDSAAALVIASLCPRCAARREAAKIRRRAKRLAHQQQPDTDRRYGT
jgi:hypothetical protein